MDARLQSVEIGLSGHWPIPTLVASAQEAERCGFPRLWLAENYFVRSISVMATAACQATRRIDIGLGIVNPYTRLVPLIAMEAATLDELSGGRVTLALGVGRTPSVPLGADLSKSITTLRESMEICRRLFAGERLGYSGAAYHIPPAAVQLSVRPLRGGATPVYLGVMGPRGLRLAGEKADGAFLSVFSSPAFVRTARRHVQEGLHAAGRDEAGFYFGSYAVFAVDRNRQAARDLVRPSVADYIGRRTSAPEHLIAAGIDADRAAAVRSRIKDAFARGDEQEAVRLVPDDFCDRVTVCGTPDDCCAALQGLAEAGLRSVAAYLYKLPGRDPAQMIRRIAEEVVPHVCATGRNTPS